MDIAGVTRLVSENVPSFKQRVLAVAGSVGGQCAAKRAAIRRSRNDSGSCTIGPYLFIILQRKHWTHAGANDARYEVRIS